MTTLSEDLLEGADAAAAHIGINRRAVYRMTESGHLPAIRKGRRIFYRKSDLERAFQVITADDEREARRQQTNRERRALDRLAEMIAPAITPFVLSLNTTTDAAIPEVMEQAVDWSYAWAEAVLSYRAERGPEPDEPADAA